MMTSLLMLFLLVPTLVSILLTLNLFFATHLPDSEKLQSYECGLLPVMGQTRGIFTIHYINVTFLFLVLDLELVLVVPASIALPQIGVYGFSMAIGFFLILTVGFVLEISQKVIQLTDIKTGYTVNDNTNFKETIWLSNNIRNIQHSSQIPDSPHLLTDNVLRTEPATPWSNKQKGGARKLTILDTLIIRNKFDIFLKFLIYIMGSFITILLSFYIKEPIYADPSYFYNKDLLNLIVFHYDFKQVFCVLWDLLEQIFNHYLDELMEDIDTETDTETEAEAEAETVGDGEEIENNKNLNEGDQEGSGGDQEGSGGDQDDSERDPAEPGRDPAESGSDKDESESDQTESISDPDDSGYDRDSSGRDQDDSGYDPDSSGSDQDDSGSDQNESPEYRPLTPEGVIIQDCIDDNTLVPTGNDGFYTWTDPSERRDLSSDSGYSSGSEDPGIDGVLGGNPEAGGSGNSEGIGESSEAGGSGNSEGIGESSDAENSDNEEDSGYLADAENSDNEEDSGYLADAENSDNEERIGESSEAEGSENEEEMGEISEAEGSDNEEEMGEISEAEGSDNEEESLNEEK